MADLGFTKTDKIGDKNEPELANQLIKQWDYLAGLRGTWESHWTEIAKRVDPMSSFLFQSLQNMDEGGDKRNQEILDSTAMLALGRFAAILDSLLTPRNSFWHQLMPGNNNILRKNKPTMEWFQTVNTILFEQRYSPTANFAAQNQNQYVSLGAYGTGGLFIDDLAGRKGIRYKGVHLSELYLQENHQGIPDRVCRHFQMTLRQAMQKFGNNLPEAMIAKAKDGRDLEAKFRFLHWVCPRTDKDPYRRDFKGMDYASYYISIEGRKLVGEGGYQTFPYALSRYRQSPGEAYGRSPAMDVLPAIKTLNKQKEIVLKTGQFASDPVMLVHDDGIMDGSALEPGTWISGAVSASGQLLAQPMPTGRVDIGKELMDDERAVINDTFLVTLFQILTETPEMTATEVMERTREKGILLAPTIGRQQSEYLGPMIDRELDILSRQGMLPPMPPFLREAEGEYTIQYDSPITRTQKADWAAGAVRTLELLLNYATQAQDPSVLDTINMDVAGPQIAEINGTPSSWLRSKEDIAQIRASRNKQIQTQTAIEAAPAVAGMMKANQG